MINNQELTDNRIDHENMVRVVAITLQKQGFYVQAKHIFWINGQPLSYNGHTPDIVATNNYGGFIMEIEDCSTYSDEYTREQLTAFSKVKGYECCLIVPEYYKGRFWRHSMKLQVCKILQLWGLNNIHIGFYNFHSGTVKFINKTA
jgi:hypothetical protein